MLRYLILRQEMVGEPGGVCVRKDELHIKEPSKISARVDIPETDSSDFASSLRFHCPSGASDESPDGTIRSERRCQIHQSRPKTS